MPDEMPLLPDCATSSTVKCSLPYKCENCPVTSEYRKWVEKEAEWLEQYIQSQCDECDSSKCNEPCPDIKPLKAHIASLKGDGEK